MAIIATQAIADASMKLRWREPYVTSGTNRILTSLPRGCYRGFWVEETAGVPDQRIWLKCASSFGTATGVAPDNLAAISDETAGYAFFIRESGDIEISLAAAIVWPPVAPLDLWVSMQGVYTTFGATVGQYNVSDTDPLLTDPNAVVLGVIHLNAGAMVVQFSGGGPTATMDYAQRTMPQPTARRTIADYIAGDHPYGWLSGIDRYTFPTLTEKDAMDNATAPSASNPFVTKNETIDLIFAEPTVVQVTLPAGQAYVDLPQVTYGDAYVGRGATGTAQRYFDVRVTDSNAPVVYDGTSTKFTYLYVYRIAKPGTGVEINPVADADTLGFYGAASGVRVYFSHAYSATSATTLDVWYGRRRAYADLNQAPASALANVLADRWGHATRQAISTTWEQVGTNISVTPTVNNVIDALFYKVRGSHEGTQTESNIAARLWTGNNVAAHPIDGEIYIDTAGYPRHLVYGYERLGTGLRFVAINNSDAGLVKVELRAITQYGQMSPPLQVDLLADIRALQPLIFASNWRIADMASDGECIYLRAYASDGTIVYHYLDCFYFTGTRKSTWAAPVFIGSHAVDATLTAFYALNVLRLIVANSSYVAINAPWENLFPAGITDRGLYLYNKSTGAAVQGGYGDALSYSLTEIRASGPMTSDGSNIYFTVQSYNSTADSMKIGLCQCTIANMNVTQAGATFREVDSALAIGATVENPMWSLVWDGSYVWMNTRFTLYRWNPIADVGEDEVDSLVSSLDNYMFGPATFDGRNLWFCFADATDVVAPMDAETYFHLVKFPIASIDIRHTGGVYPEHYWKGYIPGLQRWCLLKTQSAAFSLDFFYCFGAIVYTGDSLVWNLSFKQATGLSAYLQRLGNIHGV